MRVATTAHVLAGAGLLIFSSPVVCGNTPPAVTNVTASQRTDGSNLVDIGYDLADADGDSCRVWVFVSRNGGFNWTVTTTPSSFTGDYGEGVAPGNDKAIVWDAGADLPGTYGDNFRVRVYADDGQGTPPEMVLIPGGEFEMGDHSGPRPSPSHPVHTVNLSSFHLDICEVSNDQYRDYLNSAFSQGLVEVRDGDVYGVGGEIVYCETTGSSPASRITWDGSTFGVTGGKESHPMVRVSWYGTATYANWRSAQDQRTPCYDLSTWTCNFAANGYRLPTEAEWEYAARGGYHDPYFRFPWGDAFDGSMANYWSSGDPYETGDFPYTTPVAYYDGNQLPAGADMANGYGLYDMAGNVFEWCNDWYDETYYSYSPYDNPTGPASAYYRVYRGGSWGDIASYLECAYRYGRLAAPRYSDLGFRLARKAE